MQTSLQFIAAEAISKESENDDFSIFLKNLDDSEALDAIVYKLNDEIAPAIDCTQCGNCCRSFMISVTNEELAKLENVLHEPVSEIKSKYIEQGIGGENIINTIPCHFLADNKCTIYEYRFQPCRDFPHLHQPHFQRRLFSIFMYYGTCPIIYNVVEELKVKLDFLTRK